MTKKSNRMGQSRLWVLRNLQKAATAAIVSIGLIFSLQANAFVTYTYSGNPFVSYQIQVPNICDSELVEVCPPPWETVYDGPFGPLPSEVPAELGWELAAVQNRVTGFVTLESALEPNRSQAANGRIGEVLATEFSFTAGNTTISSTSPGLTGARFAFGTDASGQINRWDISLNIFGDFGYSAISTGTGWYYLQQLGFGALLWYGGRGEGVTEIDVNLSKISARGLPNGVWTMTSDVADVPEPATLALLGVALVGLGATRRKKTA